MSLEKDVKEIKKLMEDHPIFKAATPKEVTNRDTSIAKFSKPVIVPRSIIKSISKILDYMYYEEKSHWEDYDEDPAKRPAGSSHVYNHLQALADYIGWTG